MEGWWAASYFVLWALVIVLAVMVVALARQLGTLHLRLGPRGALEMDDEGPALGEAPPPGVAQTLEGPVLDIGGPGLAQLLLFVSPGCMVCEQVTPSVRAVARMGELTPYVLTDLDIIEARSAYARKDLGAPVASARELTRSWDIPGTPYVVVLDDMGVVRAKGTVNNLEQMEGLVATAKRRIGESGTGTDGTNRGEQLHV